MEYALLQHYWWFLVSLLGALLVFLLFVQGGQSFLFSLGKDELTQKMMANGSSLSLHWLLSEELSLLRFLFSIAPASEEHIGYGC